MRKKYSVVTLCGSTRFKDEFEWVQKELTLEGNIVISVGLFGHSGDKEVWEGMSEDTATDTKKMLDDMHKEKIDMADRIYVINPDGYIGKSTCSRGNRAFENFFVNGRLVKSKLLSNAAEIYRKNISPIITFLYSAAGICPQSTHAASHNCFSNPIFA